MMGRVRFRVLGPLEVVGPGGVVALGGPRQRALLAVLLLAGGRPVARDRLIEELRLGAVEDRIEADLAGHRHVELLPELRELVTNHPERERLTGQLMLALHRSGRTAEALVVHDELSRTLERRLGVDPGDELVALERAIRRDDP